MNSLKFHGLVHLINDRVRQCQALSKDDFQTCLFGDLKSLDHEQLENLVVCLFEEHTNLTSLINDLNDLENTTNKFSVLFE